MSYNNNNPVTIESHYNPNPCKQEHYTVTIYSHTIRTTVTATPSVVRTWISKIRYNHRYQLRNSRLIVGLGVQWNPNSSYVPATLQLCVGHDCLIFQLEHTDYAPLILRRFLSDPDVIFVGVRNYNDVGLLRNSRYGFHVPRLVDLRDVAERYRGCSRGASMEGLAREVLGMDGIEKDLGVGRSCWDDEWLSEGQVEYACVDAFIGFLLGKELRVWKWVYDEEYYSSSSDDGQSSGSGYCDGDYQCF